MIIKSRCFLETDTIISGFTIIYKGKEVNESFRIIREVTYDEYLDECHKNGDNPGIIFEDDIFYLIAFYSNDGRVPLSSYPIGGG